MHPAIEPNATNQPDDSDAAHPASQSSGSHVPDSATQSTLVMGSRVALGLSVGVGSGVRLGLAGAAGSRGWFAPPGAGFRLRLAATESIRRCLARDSNRHRGPTEPIRRYVATVPAEARPAVEPTPSEAVTG